MNFPNGCFQIVQGVNVRPVPELQMCLVYRPAKPRLLMLNASMWLIIEICAGGKSRQEIEDEYAEAFGDEIGREEIREQVTVGLEKLKADSLIYEGKS